MGNGASNESSAGSLHSLSRPRSTPAVNEGGRRQHVLANQTPRRPATANENQHHPQPPTSKSAAAKSEALQRAATQRKRGNGTGKAAVDTRHAHEEAALHAFTRNADPQTRRVLELLQEAESMPLSNPVERLRLLRECYPLLEQVPRDRFDQLAVAVYQQEGEVYYQQLDMENAKSTFSRAITLAEQRVARQDTDMYMVLKRYVLSMIGMARIWYEHERDYQGFRFTDQRHPKVAAVVEGENGDKAEGSISSLASSITSDGGSVFSINEAILASMAPRAPRRQSGPMFRRVKVTAPHTAALVMDDREDEFVLHSRMTRELVASPCELLLLRCCEVVQLGHNAQSELLIPPQIELAQIYEDLALYSRALLLVRRCLGILCSVYDYDHPWVIQLQSRADRLKALLEEQMRNEMATKIQATWRMYRAMRALEDALGRPVTRHIWIPRRYRRTPELDDLGDFVGDMPEDGLMDYAGAGEEEEEPIVSADPRTWAVVPQEQSPSQDEEDENDYPDGDLAVVDEEEPDANGSALVQYDPTEHQEGGNTFTAMVPNAQVVGTTQDTQTDTDVRHTAMGDIVTVRTTTVTRTITEDLDTSDAEDEEEEEEESQPPYENGGEEDYYDEAPEDYMEREEVPPPPAAVGKATKLPAPLPPHPEQRVRRNPTPEVYTDEETEYEDDDDEEEVEEVVPEPVVVQCRPAPPQRSPPRSPQLSQRPRQTAPPPPAHQQQPQRQQPGRTRPAPSPPHSTSRQQRQQMHSSSTRREMTVTSVSAVSMVSSPSSAPQEEQGLRTARHPLITQSPHASQTRGKPQGTQTRQQPQQPPSPAASSVSSTNRRPLAPQRATVGTQADATSPTSQSSRSRLPQPPANARPHRHSAPLAPSEDDIPSLVDHRKPVTAATYPDEDCSEDGHYPGSALTLDTEVSVAGSSVSHSTNPNSRRRAHEERPQQQQIVVMKPYVPEVAHDSTREPFRDLVEPNEVYPREANGAPAFLPPLGLRNVINNSLGLSSIHHEKGMPNGLHPAASLPPSSSSSQQLIGVRNDNNNGNRGVIQVYDPRNIDPAARPGMQMQLPSPANGYPRPSLPGQQMSLQQQLPSKKVTRDHTIVRTRVVRTYRRGGDSDHPSEGGSMEEAVSERESGSSWETSGSVSWATQSNDARRQDTAPPRGGASTPSAAVATPMERAVVPRSSVRSSPMVTRKSAAKPAPASSNGDPHAAARRRKDDFDKENKEREGNGFGDEGNGKPLVHGGVRADTTKSTSSHHVTHNRRAKVTTTLGRPYTPDEL